MKFLQSTYHLNRLKKRLTWSVERLHELRQRKLKELLRYCYDNCRYYREQFDSSGAKPDDIKSFEDLAKLPILEKEVLRDRGEEIISSEMDRSCLIRYRSSGSTGIPLELWYLPEERLRMGYTVTRELFFDGMKPWYSMVNITEPRHSAPKNHWYHKLGIMNEKFLSVYDDAELNLQRLSDIKPQLLIGFPSVLTLIGNELRKSGTLNWKPKLLFTLAEVLTIEDRQCLIQLWGTNPFDLYGANEVGHVAFQCPERNGYHVNIDSVHVEILNGNLPAKPGQRGEVVVTNFDLRAMPILRYRVGDVSEWSDEPCKCGCTFPLIKEISGRSDGFLIGEGGKVFPALEVSLLLKPVQGIQQFRIIQESAENIKVEVVPTGEKTQYVDQITSLLKSRLGQSICIYITTVDEITREKSGKIRSVISNLPHPFWRN